MPWLDPSPFREIDDRDTRDMYAPLPVRLDRVQVSMPVPDRVFEKVAKLIAARPTLRLRFYSGIDGPYDLAFLKHFETHRNIEVDLVYLKSLDGLAQLHPHLASLALGSTIKKNLSLAPLARFTRLRELYLDGHQRDIDSISGLQQLRELCLRSITLPDLSLLRSFPKLKSFALKLGGTNNLRALEDVPKLQSLEIWLVRQLRDVSVIDGLRALKTLFLQNLPNVNALPALKHHRALTSLTLHGMTGVRDLSFLHGVTSLKELTITDASTLPTGELKTLRRIASLRKIVISLGAYGRSKQAADVVDLPGNYGPITIRPDGTRRDRLAELKAQRKR